MILVEVDGAKSPQIFPNNSLLADHISLDGYESSFSASDSEVTNPNLIAELCLLPENLHT
jgi:hypothetical protein